MTAYGELGDDLWCNIHTRHGRAFLTLFLYPFIAICVALVAIHTIRRLWLLFVYEAERTLALGKKEKARGRWRKGRRRPDKSRAAS